MSMLGPGSGAVCRHASRNVFIVLATCAPCACGSGAGASSTSSGGNAVAGQSAESGGTTVTGGTRASATDAQGGNGAQGGTTSAASAATGGALGTGGVSTGGTSVASGGANIGGIGSTITGGAKGTGGETKDTGGTKTVGGATSMGGTKATNGGGSNCTPPTPPTASDSVTIDMSLASGAPTYRASGFIYGISQDGTQPPTTTLTDIKVRHLRGGGAQIGCPNGGYVNGQYAARWNSVKAYYAKAKAIGATFNLLTHDVWGADAVCTVPRYPGDNGDWSQYTSFLTQLISDAKANGMTGSDVRWEIWNEPDYSGFWKGTQAQWLEMWKRGYQQIRAALPEAIIEGPSLASLGWMNAFLDYVKSNNVVPNTLGWHEAGGGDPIGDGTSVKSAMSSRGLSIADLDVSEYGSKTDQTPGHSAWYIARFERAGIDGMRSNWGGGSGLYSTLGALVTSNWQPTGQWWIYKRYADQTGLHTNVTAGSQVDAVAYQDSETAKSIVVVGNKGGTTGSVNVVIKNIPSWLQNNGTTKVVLERMPNGTTAVTAPTTVSSTASTVTCNALTVTISWTTAGDGYVVTLTPT